MTATDHSLQLISTAAQAAADKLAHDIVAYDVSDVLSITDAFLLASAPNDRQVKSIVDEIEERLSKELGVKPVRREGDREARWVLLDYVDLGEDEALIEARVPSAWLDKSLSELDLSQKMGLTVLALKPQNGPGSLPHGDTVLRDGDVLVVGGPRKALDRSPLVQPDGR